jgi:hypothetical protein
MRGMILLISPSDKNAQCVAALQSATGEPAQMTDTLRHALPRLRTENYSAVVIDQLAADSDPESADSILENLGTAAPVFVNFAITGVERLTRDVQAALRRRKKEDRVAQRAAQHALESELKGTVTAMLLSCELALAVPQLPVEAAAKIEAIHKLAQQMRETLEKGD